MLLGLLVCVLTWAYWPTLADIVQRWSTNPQYSHGYFVPGFALYLLWHRRGMVRGVRLQPSMWAVAWVALGGALHLAGALYYFEWVSAASLLPVLVGVTLAFGGAKALRWTWPAIAFLVFMMPLPYRLEVSLAYPLQRLATVASTYVLQTLGFAAVAEGNIIIMEATRIGVVEACNGLGMLMTFFALATAMAIVLPCSPLDKLIIGLSAIPIALVANLIRITATGVLAELVGAEFADEFFHGFAGFLMMPLALLILWAERWLLARLFIEQSTEESMMFAPMARVKLPSVPVLSK